MSKKSYAKDRRGLKIMSDDVSFSYTRNLPVVNIRVLSPNRCMLIDKIYSIYIYNFIYLLFVIKDHQFCFYRPLNKYIKESGKKTEIGICEMV